MKKIISLVLVCIMVATLLPVAVFADGETEIASAEDFAKIADNLDGNYKLTTDITITNPLSYKNEGAKFTGTFDGNGHTIKVNINDEDRQRSALFCTVGGDCTIKNLTVEGTVKSNGNSTAGLIGTVKDNETITIDNVTVDVDILDCNNAGNGQAGFIGAVEDSPKVVIKNSTNKGTIEAEVPGGFIGKTSGDSTIEITDCVNEGNITCLNKFADRRGAGGFIGCVQEKCTVKLTNCTNKGTVRADYVSAGALVGDIHYKNPTEYNKYTVTNCKNEGKVISGGLELADAQALKYNNSIWGAAAFAYNYTTRTLTGAPRYDILPNIDGCKVYVNGTEVAGGVTTGTEDRQLVYSVDASTAEIDGFVAVTVIFADGSYATHGTAVSKEAVDTVDSLTGYEKLDVNLDSVSSTNPLHKDDKVNAHGSEKNLFTGNNDKYEGWKLGATNDPVTVFFSLNEAKVVTYYTITTGNDDSGNPDRQLVEWKLYGSTDGETYVELDYVNGYDFPNYDNAPNGFAIENDKAYQHYKIEMITFASELTNYDGDVYVQVGEVTLYKECDHTWGDPVVVDKECEKDGSSTVTCTKCGKEVVTVLEHEGHKFVDGTCTECGAPDPSVEDDNPTTGDITLVLMLVSLAALLSTALVVAKKRSLVK